MTLMQVVTTREELAEALSRLPSGPQRALVPTMGALHNAHANLVRRACFEVQPDGAVVVSIFVNPRQFGPDEDLNRYPRPLADDLELLAGLGADVVWTPTVDDMYPPGADIEAILPDSRGSVLEGASRPGHFAGVLTVVNLLFDAVQPGVAVFGEKDYQQLVLIRELARQRGDVRIVGAPLVRDSDGLALSSRNAYLSVEDRRKALIIPQAIWTAQRIAMQGGSADRAQREATAVFNGVYGVTPDYVVITDPELRPVSSAGPARILVAAVVGGVRLLDNAALDLQGVH